MTAYEQKQAGVTLWEIAGYLCRLSGLFRKFKNIIKNSIGRIPASNVAKPLTIMKLLLNICFVLLFAGTAKGQTDSLFSRANHAQKLRLQNIFSEERDSVFSYFDTTMKQLLKSYTCGELPDTSSHYFLVNGLNDANDRQTLAYAFMNNVVITSVRDFRIYSWDDLEGGSYHSYTCYLHYRNKLGDCVTVPLDTSEQDAEAGYYAIEQAGDYFIVFGYGTYGGGEQHFIIRLFKNEKGDIIEYNEGCPEGQVIMIGSNRSQDVNLAYNQKNQTITYDEYEFDDDTGFYSGKSSPVRLVFNDGKLIKK